MIVRCKNHRLCEIWVMFFRLKLGPQDSLLSQVFLHSSTGCHFTERRRGGGGVMFLLRFVCEHLINVNNSCYGRCYGRCYGKSQTLPIRFLKFHRFMAGNRVRSFQDSIPKCLQVTILQFLICNSSEILVYGSDRRFVVHFGSFGKKS